MPLNEIERLVIDIAWRLGAEGDKAYWYAKENNDPELINVRNAVNQGSAVDSTARASATSAHSRLNKLRTI